MIGWAWAALTSARQQHPAVALLGGVRHSRALHPGENGPWSAVYSSRSATIGSTRDARRAGIAHAASATSISTTATPPKVAGSWTGTANTRLDSARLNA